MIHNLNIKGSKTMKQKSNKELRKKRKERERS